MSDIIHRLQVAPKDKTVGLLQRIAMARQLTMHNYRYGVGNAATDLLDQLAERPDLLDQLMESHPRTVTDPRETYTVGQSRKKSRIKTP